MSHDEFVDMLLNAMKSRRDFYRQNQDSVEDKKEAGESAGEVAKLLTLSSLGRQIFGEKNIFDHVMADLRKHTQWGVLNNEFDFDNGKLVHHYVQGIMVMGENVFPSAPIQTKNGSPCSAFSKKILKRRMTTAILSIHEW